MPLRAAGAFGLGTWVVKGKTSALEFFAGYIVEQSLSVDNLFIFIMLFDYFKVPAEFQVTVGMLVWTGAGRGAVVLVGTVDWIIVMVMCVPRGRCTEFCAPGDSC